MVTTPARAWTKLLGSPDYDYAEALTTGCNGAIDEQANSGSADTLLAKCSADCTQAWTRPPPRARDLGFGVFSKTGVFDQTLNDIVLVSRPDKFDALASWNCGTQKTIQRLSL
jgi:hypothetical protein